MKLTFAKGAKVADPAGLFNASLDGNVRYAIDICANEMVDAEAFKALVRAVTAVNTVTKQSRAQKGTRRGDGVGEPNA